MFFWSKLVTLFLTAVSVSALVIRDGVNHDLEGGFGDLQTYNDAALMMKRASGDAEVASQEIFEEVPLQNEDEQIEPFIEPSMGKRTMALGRLGFRPGKRSLALGRHAFRPGKRSLALGRLNFRPGKRSLALGRHAFRPGKRSLALGRGNFRPGKRSSYEQAFSPENEDQLFVPILFP